MEININMHINKCKNIRLNFFRWRCEVNLVYKILLASAFACITGLLAQIRIYLPWTVVPITGQTFAVLLSAIVLGKWWGGISQTIYLSLGLAGVPWFTPLEGMGIFTRGGIGVLLGPTGGYLIGFVITAFLIGYLVDRYTKSRGFLTLFSLMLFGNFMIIYGFGLIQLYTWYTLSGIKMTLESLLIAGMIPFIIGDIIKILLTAGVSTAILPKEPYTI
ncbi:MAG: biotin transporter BioY [Candidatus Thermoplasmatota archaeon]